MTLVLQLLSAGAFLFFGTACLISEKMLSEFTRYGLDRWRVTVGVLQLLGAAGLLVGLALPWAARVGSGGLALLMLLGVGVRLKIRDPLPQALPAFFFFLLNAVLFLLLR